MPGLYPDPMAERDEKTETAGREAFVVWVERGTAPELCGILERTADSERLRFESAEDLLGILQAVARPRRPRSSPTSPLRDRSAARSGES